MADNPYVNKVEYDGQTLMDLTDDTVTPSDVLSGVTFHDRSGAAQTGSLITHNVIDNLNSSSASDALSANQGKVLNSKITFKGNISSSSSKTFDVENSTRALVVIMGTSDTLCAIYAVSASSSGTVSAVKLLDIGSRYTFNTATTNKVTITSSTSSTAYVGIINFQGSVS